MSYRSVARVTSRLLLVLALAESIPALCALWYGEDSARDVFLLTSSLTGIAGFVLAFLGRGSRELYRREGILVVVAGWMLASAFGALPYLVSGTMSSPVDALFESASGFTTTGASVLTDIEGQGRAVLFWRSFTQWLGGMGIIVLFVALLPEVAPGARFLFKLEVPGPTAETLHPRVRDTAVVLWQIYCLLTLAQTALLLACGFDLYDALTHTFSTLSTGGFSPRNASVAAFASPAAEIVIIVFMILAGANFSLFYGAVKRGLGHVLRDTETRAYLAILGVVTLLITVDLVGEHATTPTWRHLLDASFQVASIITTTGFATADFDVWPHVSRALLVAIMFVGGCAGSTAGSIKVMRVLIGLKAAFREVRLLFSPSTVQAVFVGGAAVPDPVVRAVFGFFILFLTSWGVGTVLLAFGGHDLVTAASAAIATLANVGPGLAEVGPTRNFAHFSAFQKLVMVLLMWLGRLEVYSFAALATRRFWRP